MSCFSSTGSVRFRQKASDFSTMMTAMVATPSKSVIRPCQLHRLDAEFRFGTAGGAPTRVTNFVGSIATWISSGQQTREAAYGVPIVGSACGWTDPFDRGSDMRSLPTLATFVLDRQKLSRRLRLQWRYLFHDPPIVFDGEDIRTTEPTERSTPLRSRVQMPILFGEYPLSERRHLFVRVSFFHYPILRFNYLLYILRE